MFSIFGKISLIIWLVVFISITIMFDLFGSREYVSSLMDSTQTVVEKLERTGDHVQGVIDVVSEGSETLEDAKEAVGEKVN